MNRVSTRRCVSRDEILAVARSIGVLGGGAASAPRIMAALCDPQVEAEQVKRLLQDEPTLCVRILRVANSPLYGQTKSVTSLERALMVLGLDAARGIAAAACLDRALVADGKRTSLDLPAVMRHSQATAAIADSLARLLFPELAAGAFIAGLLHNLGTVVQMHVDPVGIEALLAARRGGDARELASLEAEWTAIGHEQCGGILFEEWGLPPTLISAARHHHDPLSAPETERRLVALISLSAALALANGAHCALECAAASPDRSTLELLRLDEAQLTASLAAIAPRVSELEQALRAA